MVHLVYCDDKENVLEKILDGSKKLFIKPDISYVAQITEMAYENYIAARKTVYQLEKRSSSEIGKSIEEAVKDGHGVLYVDGDRLLGYLLCTSHWGNSENQNYCFPVWGYGSIAEDSEKIISMLFQKLAEEHFNGRKIHYEFKFYPHDEKIIKLFSFMQFGIQCVEEIRCTDEVVFEGEIQNIQELTRREIQTRWAEVWDLIFMLTDHLRKSPIFYPGEEFSEEIYKNYLLDEDTRLFVYEIEGEIIGIIDASKNGNSFITDHNDYYNVGDIYVKRRYRGQLIAQKLLQHVNDVLRHEGISHLWVEHGTANPNARIFWNKYFTIYSYTLIRDIYTF